MVTQLIPNLILAHSEPGQSEPTEYKGKVIPKSFTSLFVFEDGEKTWSCDYTIKVSSHGTPKLMSVEIRGSVAKNPRQLQKTYTKENMHELLEIVKGKRKSFTDEELAWSRETAPEADSVERWQIKLIEQYRFQLFELAVRLAYEYDMPGLMKTPSGEKRIMWLEKKPLTESELKEIQKEIGKSIRKKITPEFLEEVAKIYTEAGLRGEFPTKAVQEFYKCSRRTAEDYVMASRKMKFLPPVKEPGKMSVRKPRKKKGEVSGKSKRTK